MSQLRLDEEEALRICHQQTTELLQDKDLLALVQTLIGFRRGYVAAYRALQEYLEQNQQRTVAGQALHPLLQDFLVQYAAYEASKPFDERQLLQGLLHDAFPTIAKVVDNHIQQDQEQQQEEQNKQAALRKARPLPIGAATIFGQEKSLPKETFLVLTGWTNAVWWVLDTLRDNLVFHSRTLDAPAYLVAHLTKRKLGEDRFNLLHVEHKLWHNMASSHKKFFDFISEYVISRTREVPDALVVDDLSELIPSVYQGRPAAANAGDAQRVVRRWAASAGCGLLAAVPMSAKEPPDITLPEWEQLRAFCCLRPVFVLEQDTDLAADSYRIVLGDRAHFWDVRKEVLDNYPVLEPAHA